MVHGILRCNFRAPICRSSNVNFKRLDVIPEKPTLTSDEQRDSDSWTEPDQQSGESPKMTMRSPGISPSFTTMGTTCSPALPTIPLVTPTRVSNDNSVGTGQQQGNKSKPG